MTEQSQYRRKTDTAQGSRYADFSPGFNQNDVGEWTKFINETINDPNGAEQVASVILTLRNKVEVLERRNKTLEDQNQLLRQQALLDELTGLPNRRGRREYLEMIARNYDGRNYGVLVIDVNLLRISNKVFGNKTGDEMLVMLSQALKDTFRTEDFLSFQGLEDTGGAQASRSGGDEFGVVLSDVDEEGIKSAKKRLIDNISKMTDPLFVGTYEGPPLEVSIGHAIVDTQKGDLFQAFDEAFDTADRMMQQEKRMTKDKFKEQFSIKSDE